MLILLLTLGILLVLVDADLRAAAGPRAGAHAAADRRRCSSSSAIGLGFLLLEVALIQRFVLFLGFPTYALSVVLFALLVFTGLGSLLSSRRGAGPPRRRLAAPLGIACVLIAASAYGLQPLLRELIDLPFAVRVICTVVMLAPFGLTLGMAMPIGLQRLQGLYPEGVPWAWGVNGVASVVASVLAIAVAINFGFQVTTLVALACYLGALAHVLLGRWPQRPRAWKASPRRPSRPRTRRANGCPRARALWPRDPGSPGPARPPERVDAPLAPVVEQQAARRCRHSSALKAVTNRSRTNRLSTTKPLRARRRTPAHVLAGRYHLEPVLQLGTGQRRRSARARSRPAASPRGRRAGESSQLTTGLPKLPVPA